MRNRPRKPNEVFKRCPVCGSVDVCEVAEEVVCLDCSWDSAAAHVDVGGMDYGPFSLPKKTEEHGGDETQTISATLSLIA